MNNLVYKQSKFQHPLKRSFINYPQLDIDLLNRKYEDDHFPTIKYIMVTKVMESEKPFKMRGQKQITRYYSIGILTTMNQYFYSEIHTRNMYLTRTLVKDLKLLFLTHYRYDENTKILFSDNIDLIQEPIAIFLSIVVTVKKIRIDKANLRQMLKALNDVYRYIKPTRPKDFRFTNRNNKRMIRKLFELKRFEFITDPYWELQLETMGPTERRANVETAVGILYMYIKEYRRNVMKRYHENRIRKEQEKLYNIEVEKDKKEETDEEKRII